MLMPMMMAEAGHLIRMITTMRIIIITIITSVIINTTTIIINIIGITLIVQ